MSEPAAARPRVRFAAPEQARELAARGAPVFDTRGLVDRTTRPVRGAVGFQWTRWRDGWLRTGRVTDDTDAMVASLRRSGLRFGAPVVVAGPGRGGFGEEGRLAWTLAWLGYDDVVVLDRTIDALGELRGGGAARELGPRPALRPHLRATLAEVRVAVQAGTASLWDARSPEEFSGATPYGEARGGHLPGARSLYWRDLYGDDGVVRPPDDLRARVVDAGVPFDRPVITACSGGVRSAFAWAALASLGHPYAANYDGGMWEWTAESSRPLISP
jgi:thiosulfate/3-mercaptopyruvate sulfurtransferase